MDPATFTLIVGLSGGAFICLALLYITTPYPIPTPGPNPDPYLHSDLNTISKQRQLHH